MSYLCRPSAAAIWVECHGQPQMACMVPAEEQTEQSLEGSAVHWLAEQLLEECIKANTGMITAVVSQYAGTTAPNGVKITDEMCDGAQFYVDHLAGVLDKRNAWAELSVEESLQSSIHPEIGGTPDAFWFDHDEGTLWIWDFKYGRGDVDAFENWQLACYYDCILNYIDVHRDDVQAVQFVIVQPRCFTAAGPVKTWSTTVEKLDAMVSRLRTAAIEAVRPGTTTTSGNHCRYCRAKYVCESSRQAALDGVRYSNTATPVQLTDQALAIELITLRNAIRDLKYRESALTIEAEAAMSEGKSLPGLSVARAQANRTFKDGSEVLKDLVPEVDLLTKPSLVTPAEAERRLKKAGYDRKQINDVLGSFVERPAGKLKVIVDDGSEMRKTFG